MNHDQNDLRGITTDIVSHYLSRNHIPAAELPALISSVHAALAGTAAPVTTEPEKPAPAVPLKKAVQPEAITCLFDGRKFKAMKRHLTVDHGMTPAEYRQYWGLPKDSPMTAPLYSEARSGLAKSLGLGQGGRRPKAPQQAPTKASKGRDGAPPSRDDVAPVAPPKRRGRAPKAT